MSRLMPMISENPVNAKPIQLNVSMHAPIDERALDRRAEEAQDVYREEDRLAFARSAVLHDEAPHRPGDQEEQEPRTPRSSRSPRPRRGRSLRPTRGGSIGPK